MAHLTIRLGIGSDAGATHSADNGSPRMPRLVTEPALGDVMQDGEMATDVTWCSVSASARLVSGHRWGLYRWPAAISVVSVAAAVLEDGLGWVGPAVGIVAGLGCLWLLPGQRVGVGFDEDGVVARGWVVRRSVSWSQIDVLLLGKVSGPIIAGGLPGVAAVCGKHEFRLQQWFGRPLARSSGLAPLVAMARSQGVHVLLAPLYQYAFPGVVVDQIGLVRIVDGMPVTASLPDSITRRSATALVIALAAVGLAGIVAVAYGLAEDQGGVVSFGSVAVFIGVFVLIEAVPLCRWARARGPG